MRVRLVRDETLRRMSGSTPCAAKRLLLEMVLPDVPGEGRCRMARKFGSQTVVLTEMIETKLRVKLGNVRRASSSFVKP